MRYDAELLNRIYDRTDERCHLCGDGLVFPAYGKPRRPGSWEVDHDWPRARGGGDAERNLLPAHISCNRSKQARRSRDVRARHGLAARPLSRAERWDARVQEGARFGCAGALVGVGLGLATCPAGQAVAARAAYFGAIGALVGALVGGALDPERRLRRRRARPRR